MTQYIKFRRNDIVYVAKTDRVYYVHAAQGINYEVSTAGEHYHRLIGTDWLNRHGRKIDDLEAELLKLNRLS